MTDNLWLGRDTVIFVIRFTFHVLRLTRNDLRMLADFFNILLSELCAGPGEYPNGWFDPS
jgi:hypothetical protein